MLELFKSKITKPTVVTFTGGMGAQMISAAIYFQIKSEGHEVFADLSYFEKKREIAIEGIAGKVSHWDSQMNPFALQMNSFVSINNLSSKKYKIIDDGVEKLRLGIRALKNERIKSIFSIHREVIGHFPNYENGNYLCIHVRRGDYINVSSHLITDDSFIRLAGRFSKLVNQVIVVSDSVIPELFKTRLTKLFAKTFYLDDIDEFQSHCIMRNAAVLLCSNSQFSLIAALLNTNGLVILPRTWFGAGQPQIEAVVSNLGQFQILD